MRPGLTPAGHAIVSGAVAKSRITSIDVARLAKVSQSAVSRTFTPGASVSEKTRRRVLEATRQLGYRPNAIASSLSSQRSRIVGVVVSHLQNPFYSVALERLSRRLQAAGYHVLLFVSDTPDADPHLEEILRYQVDAIVLASTVLSSPLARECEAAGVGVLYFNRVSEVANCAAVTSDNALGGRMAAEFLAGMGRRRIAYVAGLGKSSTNAARESGFLAGLAAAKLRCVARAEGRYDFAQAGEAARVLFRGPKRPDAVFVANDHMAFAVMDTIRSEFQLRIPEDVAVIGFDNVPQAAWPAYQLTTVEQPVDQMVDAAVELLVGEAGTGAARRQHVVVPCRLVVRASAPG